MVKATDLQAIGHEYLSPHEAPDAAIVADWKAFANWTTIRARQISSRLYIELTDNPEPYATAEEQAEDIASGHFTVSTANSEHPIWSVQQNVNFRIWHDVEGHTGWVDGAPVAGAPVYGFDRAGEVAAYNRSVETLPYNLKPVLFVESMGQLGGLIVSGTFPSQNCYRSAISLSLDTE